MISMPNPTVLPRATESFEAWYDAKSEDEQLLIDEINNIFVGFDEEEYEQFIKLLRDDIGIITADNLTDAFFYQTDSYNAEEEFAEYLHTEFVENDIPDILQGCIDWQLVWDTAYRFDFSSIQFGTTKYFFHNEF